MKLQDGHNFKYTSMIVSKSVAKVKLFTKMMSAIMFTSITGFRIEGEFVGSLSREKES